MKTDSKEFLNLIKNPGYIISLLLTVFLSYGYHLSNKSVGIDDLVRSRYQGGGLLYQGRYSSILLNFIFNFKDEDRYFLEPLVALIFLTLAAIIYSIILNKASYGTLKAPFQTFFSCLFVSFPLISEIFVYKGSDLHTGVGHFVTACVVLILMNSLEGSKKKAVVGLAVASVLSFFLVSLYESFAFVYSLFVCVILFFGDYFSPEKTKFKNTLTKIVFYVIPLVTGVAIKFLIDIIVKNCVHFDVIVSAGSTFALGKFFKSPISTFYQLFRKFFLAGLWYFPIGLFVITFVASLIFFILWGVKKKSPVVILYAFGIYLSLFMIGIVTAGSVKYRTCTNFAPFVAICFAFAAFFIVDRFKNKIVKFLTCSFASILIAAQILSIFSCFYYNVKRWNEDKAIIITVGEKLTSGDYNIQEKPVIFIGECILSDEIMSKKYVRADNKLYVAVKKFAGIFGFDLANTDFNETYVLATCQSDFGSLVDWGIDDSKAVNDELLRAFAYLGYDLKPGTMERYKELCEREDEFPKVLETGIITELDDVIVVRF